VWRTPASVGVFLYPERMTYDLHLDFGWLGPIYLLAVAWPLTVIDLRERRLPNRLTLPAFPLTFAGQIFAIILGADLSRLLIALLGAVLAFAACLALNHSAGLGMGDVKLITVMTLALAWFSPLLPALALLAGFTIAGVVSLALVALRKTRMGSSIALGPYLLIGFLLALIAQGWS
jgi:leader peptidase (prepilin peptidase)/N-methyltransferase